MSEFKGGWVRSFGVVCVLGVFFALSNVTLSERDLTSLMAAARAQGPSANKPVQWEQLVRGEYENRGVARIERLGERWVLSVWCRGTHSTYLDATTLDLNQYADRFVRVRYRYVQREVADPKCVRGPCSPIRERRMSIEQITPLRITLQEAQERGRECK